jgi:hypothetical protein
VPHPHHLIYIGLCDITISEYVPLRKFMYACILSRMYVCMYALRHVGWAISNIIICMCACIRNMYSIFL